MPLHNKHDDYGHYYQFGDHGYKYYYDKNNKHSEFLAKRSALRQGRAIEASKRRRESH
jgi:hypothetical protein